MSQPFITIFTPTYNRIKLLPILYQSLINQTTYDFIWLIIDDGSTDGTQDLVQSWQKEKFIQIKYIHQHNQGKASAFNHAIDQFETPLFLNVDSDDSLTPNAVEKVIGYWNKLNDDNSTGIIAFKINQNGQKITQLKNHKVQSFSLFDGYSKYGLKGDTMLVFRKEVIKRYRFPIFPKEKFVPEAFLYDLIDQHGTLLVLRKSLLKGDYLADGYTSQIHKLIACNPNGYFSYIKNRVLLKQSYLQRISNYVRLFSILFVLKSENKNIRILPSLPIRYFFSFPIGYILYLVRFKKYTLFKKDIN
jgi:glycosyltransferase involved in cell wall biosynthesis